MYDTIKEIKDYYVSVYELIKKYEGPYSSDYGRTNGNYKTEISIDGTKNSFTIKMLTKDNSYCNNTTCTANITVNFSDDGISIDADINVEDHNDPELSDSTWCSGNNLAILEFIDKLKEFRGKDIYFECCDGTIDEIIKGIIDLYKE